MELIYFQSKFTLEAVTMYLFITQYRMTHIVLSTNIRRLIWKLFFNLLLQMKLVMVYVFLIVNKYLETIARMSTA